jgi:hypothetical protein
MAYVQNIAKNRLTAATVFDVKKALDVFQGF